MTLLAALLRSVLSTEGLNIIYVGVLLENVFALRFYSWAQS